MKINSLSKGLLIAAVVFWVGARLVATKEAYYDNVGIAFVIVALAIEACRRDIAAKIKKKSGR